MKLTDAQRRLLERVGDGDRLIHEPRTGSTHAVNLWGFAMKVRNGTFNSVSLRGLIERVGPPTLDRNEWTLTPAGRAALKEMETSDD